MSALVLILAFCAGSCTCAAHHAASREERAWYTVWGVAFLGGAGLLAGSML
jgi:hypothetical protein